MNNYQFLQDFIESLPVTERSQVNHDYLDADYILNKGIHQSRLAKLQSEHEIILPKELENFYSFSYGALLNEIKILTIPEIIETIENLKPVDDVGRLRDLLPFAILRGVGDTFAFDMSQEKDGHLLILDGFHEFPLSQWEGICYGLHNWLTKMVEKRFEPFWLK